MFECHIKAATVIGEIEECRSDIFTGRAYLPAGCFHTKICTLGQSESSTDPSFFFSVRLVTILTPQGNRGVKERYLLVGSCSITMQVVLMENVN